MQAILDSGATITISGNKDNFLFLEPCHVVVECANNERMVCKLNGPLVIKHEGNEIVMANSLYIPGCVTLLSVNQMTDLDFVIVFTKGNVEIYKSRADVHNSKPYIRTEKKIGAKLWTLPVKGCTPYHGNKVKFTAYMAKFCNDANPDVIHARYCHLNLGYLRKKFPIFTNTEKLCWCDACASEAPRKPYMKKYKLPTSSTFTLTKPITKDSYVPTEKAKVIPPEVDSSKFAFPDSGVSPSSPDVILSTQGTSTPLNGSKKRTQDLMDSIDPLTVGLFENCIRDIDDEKKDLDESCFNLIDNTQGVSGFGRSMHSDTKHVSTESCRGYNYLFLVIDKDTRVCYGFLGVNINDFTPIMKRWLRRFYNKYRRFPSFWRFDSGTENLNHNMMDFLSTVGVEVEVTATKQSNENSYSERKIGVIWRATRMSLAHSGVPMPFWCYCVLYVILVYNHIPHRALDFDVPLTRAGLKTKDKYIRVFGCEIWYVTEKGINNQSHNRRGIFLGLSSFKMGYDILDLETGVVAVSRNVNFNEVRMPFRDAMQPCLINLDFGTWPKNIVVEKVSIPNLFNDDGNVFDVVSNERGDVDVEEEVPYHPSQSIPLAAIPTPPITPIIPITENPLSPASNLVSPPNSSILDTSFDMKHVDPEISPISNIDDWDETIPYPIKDLSSEISPQTPRFPKLDRSLLDESTLGGEFSEKVLNKPFTPNFTTSVADPPKDSSKDSSIFLENFIKPKKSSKIPKVVVDSKTSIKDVTHLEKIPPTNPDADPLIMTDYDYEIPKSKGILTDLKVNLAPKKKQKKPKEKYAVDLERNTIRTINNNVSENEYFEVDKVTKHRKEKDGLFSYLTKWKDSDELQWLPAANFDHDAECIKLYKSTNPGWNKPKAPTVKKTPSYRNAQFWSESKANQNNLDRQKRLDNRRLKQVYFGQIPMNAPLKDIDKHGKEFFPMPEPIDDSERTSREQAKAFFSHCPEILLQFPNHQVTKTIFIILD